MMIEGETGGVEEVGGRRGTRTNSISRWDKRAKVGVEETKEEGQEEEAEIKEMEWDKKEDDDKNKQQKILEE